MKREEIHSLNTSTVIIAPGRIRRGLGNLDDLKASIKSKGQLHPIIVNKENVLISGERRLEACRGLRIAVLARYMEDLNESDMIEIEVMENAARLDFSWIESVRAIKKLHDYKVQQHGKAVGGPTPRGWGFEKTAKLIGSNPQTVRLDCRTADYLDEYPELMKLQRKSEAFKRIRDIIEDAALIELANRSASGIFTNTNEEGEDSEEEKLPQITPEEIMQMDDLSDEDKKRAIAIIDVGKKASGKMPDSIFEEAVAEFTEEYGEPGPLVAKRFIHGDAFELIKEIPDESFQLIITDPPYGIKVGDTTASKAIGVFDDSADWMESYIPTLLKECYRVLGEDSHMYLFFAVSYYEFLLKHAKEVGFDFDPLPIIWVKGSYAGKSGDPKRYPGRCYEMILYLRKGNMPLVKAGIRNVIVEDPVFGTAKIHPTEKPIGVIRNLLRRSGHPNIKVFDPMAGSGTTLLAGMQWGYEVLGFEQDDSYYAGGYHKLVDGFRKLAVPQMRFFAKESCYAKGQSDDKTE